MVVVLLCVLRCVLLCCVVVFICCCAAIVVLFGTYLFNEMHVCSMQTQRNDLLVPLVKRPFSICYYVYVLVVFKITHLFSYGANNINNIKERKQIEDRCHFFSRAQKHKKQVPVCLAIVGVGGRGGSREED